MRIHSTYLTISASKKLAYLLILATLLWATGAPFSINRARAALLTNISYTLSDSDLGVAASSTLRFTTTNAILANETIKVDLDPDTSLFTEAFTVATSSEFFLDAGGVPYAIVDSCTAGNEATLIGNYNDGIDENFTITICSGASTIPASTVVTILAGSLTGSVFFNPPVAGSYTINVGGTMTDSGATKVAIIDDVVVTASVDTVFTFVISGMPASSMVNGTSTTVTSTDTALPFGTLIAGIPATASQRLNVLTNASNGFVVTVFADVALSNGNGDDVDFFKDGSHVSTPTAWTAPVGTSGNENTYGHLGVTSSDDVNGNEFSGNKYAGNFDATARAVFANAGPADGVTANVGSTTVGYTIQISGLQEAGNDYTNTLTYVATPVF